MTNRMLPALLGLAIAAAMSVPLAHAQNAQQKPGGGTLKGAAVGGVAGHMVGHTKTGAAVGAVAGHHARAKSKARLQNGGQK